MSDPFPSSDTTSPGEEETGVEDMYTPPEYLAGD